MRWIAMRVREAGPLLLTMPSPTPAPGAWTLTVYDTAVESFHSGPAQAVLDQFDRPLRPFVSAGAGDTATRSTDHQIAGRRRPGRDPGASR